MNTSGIQNYLSNVFRPIYTFDTTLSNFTPRLELSNIDTYSGNVVSVFRADVGDSASNVYVGSNSGNPFTTLNNCSDVTALGYGAANGISNVSDSVLIGWYAGAGSTGTNILPGRDVISIGKNSGGGQAGSNIFIGTNTKTFGNKNIFLGHHIDLSGVSNQIRIGYSNQTPITADLSKNWVGLCGYTSPVHPNDKLDVSGNLFVLGNIGLNTEPGVEATLDINGNFQTDDGKGRLRFLTTGTNSDLSFLNYTGGTSTFNVEGKTTSTTGFSSIQSNVTLSTSTPSNVFTIGPIRKGIIQISAVSQTGPNSHYAVRILIATTSSNVTNVSAISPGDVSIQTSGTNIQLSNSGISGSILVCDYNITYFPLP